MADKENTFTMRKVAKTWTSPRLYEILKDGKAVLKLKDEDDAKQVIEYLNKNNCSGGKKGSSKTSTKKTTKKSSKKTSKKSSKE